MQPFVDSLKIKTAFDKASHQMGALAYQSIIEQRLERLLSKRGQLGSGLPLMEWQEWKEGGVKLSIYLLSDNKPHVAPFFYELLAHSIKTKIIHFLATQVAVNPFVGSLVFCEAVLEFESLDALREILPRLHFMHKEVSLGVISKAHAQRALEIRGVGSEEKTALIQSSLNDLVYRGGKLFGRDLFVLMHRYFVTFSDYFRYSSDSRHLFRLIYSSYLLCKKVIFKGSMQVRLMRVPKITPFGIRFVGGLLASFRYEEEGEVFEYEHMVGVLQKHFESFVTGRDRYLTLVENGVQLRYIEWDQKEMVRSRALEKTLSEEFERAIEKREKRIFMPRNEEEVFKYSVRLSQELKYVGDLPQVIVQFDRQKGALLSFVIIVARLLKNESPSLESFFKGSGINCILERHKTIGLLKNRFPKEVAIFRVSFSNSAFIREDHALDLLEARRFLVESLQKDLGEFRDYNGGMLAKNDQAFEVFAALLKDKYSPLLVKNFFHAIFPMEHRSVISSFLLKNFFEAFCELEKKGESFQEGSVDGVFFFIKRGLKKAIDLDKGEYGLKLRLKSGSYMGILTQNKIRVENLKKEL